MDARDLFVPLASTICKQLVTGGGTGRPVMRSSGAVRLIYNTDNGVRYLRAQILPDHTASGHLPPSLPAQQLRGDYIESRSTDVYVAQCFANGEVGLAGNDALLAWHVEAGAWNGVKLDGLTVAAAVRARATLGDPYGDPYPAQAVLMVDSAASPQQRAALIALAQHNGGRLLENVVRVEYVPVVLDAPADPHQGSAILRAGKLATIITRPLNHHDHICGNETNFYPPLTEVSEPSRRWRPPTNSTARAWEPNGRHTGAAAFISPASPRAGRLLPRRN